MIKSNKKTADNALYAENVIIKTAVIIITALILIALSIRQNYAQQVSQPETESVNIHSSIKNSSAGFPLFNTIKSFSTGSIFSPDKSTKIIIDKKSVKTFSTAINNINNAVKQSNNNFNNPNEKFTTLQLLKISLHINLK